MSQEIFNFTTFTNPPTKNEKSKISVFSRKARRRVQIVNPAFAKIWESIENEMYLKKFGIHKNQFKLLAPKERVKLQKQLTDKNVVVSLWNGFHRMDIGNFWDELVDRLQGIAYVNDKQIKEYHVYKDDECDKEYFKIIVEEMEWETEKRFRTRNQ